jgi:predicted small metal-binding protein
MAYEFSCKTAGAAGCNWKVRGATQDEVMAKVAQHAQKVHKVKKVSDTIASYARSTTRQV